MPTDLNMPFDRITYRDGQLLTASDLRDDQRGHQRHRRLHTRCIHETWGIALGFVMKKSQDGRGVIAGPGYAVDGVGRDILSHEGLLLPVPTTSTAAAFVLTVSYQEDADFRAHTDLEALCLDSGLDPRHERPIFTWRHPDEVQFGPHVPLTQVVVLNGEIHGPLDPRVRHYARPFVRPHFGWGVTEPGRTGWKKWSESKHELGLETQVDISEAGFTKPPYLFVSLQGDFSNRVGDDSPLFQHNFWPIWSSPSFFLDGLGFITQTTSESFIYRIVIHEQILFSRMVNSAEAEDRKWILSWLGAEPVTGCEPDLDLKRIFSLFGNVIRNLTF